MAIQLYHGDCLEVLATLPANSVDAVVCDPPYHLTQVSRNGSPRQNDPATPFGRTRLGSAGFMNKTWDGGDISMQPETWRLIYDVLKPGGHLLSFGGTRTYHRMTCAIEDAGFEIRDQIGFLHATGMPKSRDVHKDIEKKFGAEAAEEFRGIGSCLKPAFEPIAVCRKPLIGTLADNVVAFGTGGINIDNCRIPINAEVDDSRLGGKGKWSTAAMAKNVYGEYAGAAVGSSLLGRFPSNIVHDQSEEVFEAFAAFGEKNGGHHPKTRGHGGIGNDGHTGQADLIERFSDTGTAARFYFGAKAGAKERGRSKHPTIKSLSLMRYLVKLVTPRHGTVLDPFAGTGTTGEAAALEGFNAILIEKEAEYCEDIRRRLVLFL